MTLDEKLKRNRACRECARLWHEIDADCNDCVHFQRGRMRPPREGQPRIMTYFEGVCGRDGTAVKAYPGWYAGHSCYESRPERQHTCVDITSDDIREIGLRELRPLVAAFRARNQPIPDSVTPYLDLL